MTVCWTITLPVFKSVITSSWWFYTFIVFYLHFLLSYWIMPKLWKMPVKIPIKLELINVMVFDSREKTRIFMILTLTSYIIKLLWIPVGLAKLTLFFLSANQNQHSSISSLLDFKRCTLGYIIKITLSITDRSVFGDFHQTHCQWVINKS